MSGAAERSPGGFVLKSKFKPTGDQPEAIAALYEGLRRGEDRLVLQGVTGSGKTFTMANLIAKWGRPTLILSHNKTLAAQLFAELKEFFPQNAVEYFISYYDYYQPEAYIPQTDTYIDKDASVNEEIERYRLAATNALIARRDVIVVASVSCIYGLGESDEYRDLAVGFKVGGAMSRERLLARLVEAQYVRNDYDFAPGAFRVRGDVVDIFPAYETKAIRVEFFGDGIDSIRELDPLTGKCGVSMPAAVVTPAKQFVMGKDKFEAAFARIESELDDRLKFFASKGKLLEAQRLKERTEYDIEMMRELGYCNGIENYSRPLSGRAPGSPPECLLDYFPDDFLTIIDESHVSVPQIRAMYNGDQARKSKLVEFGFRLPSLFLAFIIGNAASYGTGILLAFLFKDNRAFCKYICPVTVFLKPMSYYSLIRVKCDREKCVNCGKCRRVCPMDVDVTDNSRKRRNGTECILCMECVKNCPKNAL